MGMLLFADRQTNSYQAEGSAWIVANPDITPVMG